MTPPAFGPWCSICGRGAVRQGPSLVSGWSLGYCPTIEGPPKGCGLVPLITDRAEAAAAETRRMVRRISSRHRAHADRRKPYQHCTHCMAENPAAQAIDPGTIAGDAPSPAGAPERRP